MEPSGFFLIIEVHFLKKSALASKSASIYTIAHEYTNKDSHVNSTSFNGVYDPSMASIGANEGLQPFRPCKAYPTFLESTIYQVIFYTSPKSSNPPTRLPWIHDESQTDASSE